MMMMRNSHGSAMKKMVVASGVVVMLVALAPSTSSALSRPVARTCDGEVATIVSAAPSIEGTAGDDVILATGTAGQTIKAGAGDDTICASSGPDRIFAGDGNDTVLAGNGNDAIDGWNGSDTIDGGFGNDTASGGAGDDAITGGPGTDTLAGNTGNDNVTGGGGNDFLSGNVGNDVISGGVGNDRTNGDAGNDMISGNEGSDTLIGGAGNDWLNGGVAPDVINPGAGSNTCGDDTSDSMRGPCAIDTAGPTISNIVAPEVVTAGETVTFTWRVTDSSGVSTTNMRIGGSSGYVTSWCGFVVVADLVIGDAFDGTYRAKCVVPATAINGEYTLFLLASDSFGNSAGLGPSAQFDFAVTGGSPDSVAPVVTVLWSGVLDDGDVLLQYRATDESGVAAISLFLALDGYSFASPQKGTYFYYGEANLGSGDATDGVYLSRMRRLSFTPNGEYTVWSSVIDTLGNTSFTNTGVTVTL